MMTRRILLVLSLLLLFAGATYFFMVKVESAAEPLDFLPADTLALIDLQQPADMYAEYRRSRLGRRINSIPWANLLREFGTGEEEANAVQTKVDEIKTFLDSAVFRELFARRAVLALLPVPTATGSSAAADPLESLVLIVRPRHRTDITELLAPLLAQDGRYSTESYLGRDIRTFLLDDNTVLAAVASEGLIITSFSIDTLKRCLELVLQEPAAGKATLNDNATYLALRKRAGGKEDQFIYVDGSAVTSLEHVLRNGTADGLTATEPAALTWESAFRHLAFFRTRGPDLLHSTVILQGAMDDAGAGLRNEIVPPTTDDSLAGVPADLLVHFWTNLLALPRMTEGLRENQQMQALINKTEEWLLRKSGTSLPEFFSLFGSQISLTVTGIRGNGFFPLPRMCGRLAIKDRQRLQEVLAKLLAGMSLTNTTVDGIRVYTVMVAGGLLQPSYAIKDDIILFADSPEQIVQSLGQPGALLLDDAQFRKIDVGLGGPNNMIAYINYPQSLEGMQQLAAWTATLMAMTDQQWGTKAKAFVDLVLSPVLDGMKMYSAGSSRLTVTPAELVMESSLLLKDKAKEDE